MVQNWDEGLGCPFGCGNCIYVFRAYGAELGCGPMRTMSYAALLRASDMLSYMMLLWLHFYPLGFS
jgi:hypothetical protein